MKAARSMLAELAGLFVEDGAFALAIAVWIAVSLALAFSGIVPPLGRGAVLFGGLIVILIASVARASRR